MSAALMVWHRSSYLYLHAIVARFRPRRHLREDRRTGYLLLSTGLALNKRLKSARTAAGMSLRALAAETHVSAMALSKYERGVIRPSPKVIEALAKALRVPPEHFTADAPLELKGVEYRASSRMTPVSKRLIHDEIRKQLGVRREIEALVPEIRSPAFRLPSRASPIVSMDEIEDVTERLRDAWGLGAQPISNLTAAQA
jgi:transcriptional regulator with XRE-family HTH domain